MVAYYFIFRVMFESLREDIRNALMQSLPVQEKVQPQSY